MYEAAFLLVYVNTEARHNIFPDHATMNRSSIHPDELLFDFRSCVTRYEYVLSAARLASNGTRSQ